MGLSFWKDAVLFLPGRRIGSEFVGSAVTRFKGAHELSGRKETLLFIMSA